jgi:hypothetical protein
VQLNQQEVYTCKLKLTETSDLDRVSVVTGADLGNRLLSNATGQLINGKCGRRAAQGTVEKRNQASVSKLPREAAIGVRRAKRTRGGPSAEAESARRLGRGAADGSGLVQSDGGGPRKAHAAI